MCYWIDIEPVPVVAERLTAVKDGFAASSRKDHNCFVLYSCRLVQYDDRKTSRVRPRLDDSRRQE